MVNEDTKRPDLGQEEQGLSNPDISKPSVDLDARINGSNQHSSAQDIGFGQLPYLDTITEPSYKYIEVPIMYSVNVLDTNTNREFSVHVPSPGFKECYHKDIVFIEGEVSSDALSPFDQSLRDIHVIMEMRDANGELIAKYIPLLERETQLNAPIRYNKTDDGKVTSICIDWFDIDNVATLGSLVELLKKPYFKKKKRDCVCLVKNKDMGQTIEQTEDRVELWQSLRTFVSDRLLVVAYHPTERFMYAEAIDVNGSLLDISDRFKYFFMRLMTILPDQETWKKVIEEKVVRDVKYRFSGINYFDSARRDLGYEHMYKQGLLKELRYATAGFLPDAETIRTVQQIFRNDNDVHQRVLDIFYQQVGVVFDELRTQFDIPEDRFRHLDAFHLPELRGYKEFTVEANPQNGTVVVCAIKDIPQDTYNFCRRVTLCEGNNFLRNNPLAPKDDKQLLN